MIEYPVVDVNFLSSILVAFIIYGIEKLPFSLPAGNGTCGVSS